ncbi:MAG: MDR family MFS transporter [Thermincola sp.]|nr:MDR family MFS transporter [Thermincola sp.]MDT3704764.1 MDR family MFS transporter [Thermincola sp.]
MEENEALSDVTAVEGKKTNRPVVLATIMMAMFIGAIEANIVATAMPSIVADLGGFSLFTWVFSAFLLTQAVTVPLYGKLADLFGRKPVFIFGVVVFLIGSILCGLARTMHALVVFRFIQGIGAGAILPIAITIVGDIYSIEERAKIQGYISSVWGISSIVGPALGAVFVQYLHWAWVFWVNIPLGILSIAGLWLFLHENIETQKHQIDFRGAVLLLMGVSALMIVSIQGGSTWPWRSGPVFFLLGLTLISFILFIIREKKVAEPVMPLAIWKNPLIAVANLCAFTTGAVMIGVATFLPTYIQGVMGQAPAVAGLCLGMMSLGWPLASTVAGRIMIRYGYRSITLLGGAALVAGAIFFVTLQPGKGPIWAAAGAFLIGAGMGLSATTFIVAIQSSVDWTMRGAATASHMFMRILGNTVGAAVLGGVLNNYLSRFLQSRAGAAQIPLDLDVANLLLDPQRSSNLSDQVLLILRRGLTESLHIVYWGVLVLALLSVLLMYKLPRKLEHLDTK